MTITTQPQFAFTVYGYYYRNGHMIGRYATKEQAITAGRAALAADHTTRFYVDQFGVGKVHMERHPREGSI